MLYIYIYIYRYMEPRGIVLEECVFESDLLGSIHKAHAQFEHCCTGSRGLAYRLVPVKR